MKIQDLPLACNFWFHSDFLIILTKVKWIANANDVLCGFQMINRNLIQLLFLNWAPENLLKTSEEEYK